MHRFTSKNGVDLIKRFEGYRSDLYYCQAGYPTIGYGHRILENEIFNTLTLLEAEQLLYKDLYQFECHVLQYIDVILNDNQFDALVSFTFNLGPGALQRSTLRQKINSKYFDEVPQEFMRWIHAGGKILNGLLKRRREESILFMKK